MEFEESPPEDDSGAGSDPSPASAASWDKLATDFRLASAAHSSVTAGLSGDTWSGPASVAMSGLAVSYLAWLNISGAEESVMGDDTRALLWSLLKSAIAHTLQGPSSAASTSGLVLPESKTEPVHPLIVDTSVPIVLPPAGKPYPSGAPGHDVPAVVEALMYLLGPDTPGFAGWAVWARPGRGTGRLWVPRRPSSGPQF